jgi:cytochrome c-type biogenesis protein
VTASEPVPLALALVAGGLVTLNPCAFPLLPAFLSFYVGADERDLPRAPDRIAQGLLVGLLISAGFLTVFAVVGLPIVYGATLVADALPPAGIVIGVGLLALGVRALAGGRVGLPVSTPVLPSEDHRWRTMLVFGAGYGVASVGCTLPLFLTLLAAATGAGGAEGVVLVFLAYAAGMTVVLVALAVGAALLHEGLARSLRRLLPWMHQIAGALLALSGSYLTYYWARVWLGPAATLASDPLVGVVLRFTGRLASRASTGGAALVGLAALIVGVAASASWLQRSRRRRAPRYARRALR